MPFEDLQGGAFSPSSAVDTQGEFQGPPMAEPTWSDLFRSSFQSQNVVGSFLSDEMRRVNPLEKEEGFDWKAGVIGDPKYERYANSFAEIFNSHARDALMQKIDREEENRRISAAGGWAGVATDMAAGVVDLPTLIPGGALVRGANGGYSIGRALVSGAIAGGIGAAASEAGLQATQATRTTSETAFTVGAGVVLGSILGGGMAGLLTTAERRAAEKATARLMDSALGGPEIREAPVPHGEGEAGPAAAPAGEAVSAGAAAVDKPTRADLSVAGGAVRTIAERTQALSPNMRLNFSPSAAVRRIAQETAENALYQDMHEAGRSLGAAVETAINVSRSSRLAEATEALNAEYAAMRKADIVMTRAEFEEAVGRAMANNDTGPNEFVSRAAERNRATLVEPLKQDAISVRALPADVDVTTAPTYAHRVWNRQKLEADEAGFKKEATKYFREKAKAIDYALAGEAQRRIAAVEAQKSKWKEKKQARASNVLSEIDDIKMTRLRRAEEAKNPGITQGEMAGAGVTPHDLASLIKMVQSGALKRPKVETLTGWLARTGGMIDEGGELARMGITNRTRPGFVRKIRRTATNKQGGWSADDAAFRAWEEGFFASHAERPSVREFLDALDGDFNGWQVTAREADLAQAELARYIDQIDDILSRLGISDPKKAKLALPEDMQKTIDQVARALDAADDQKVARLEAKLREIEREIESGDYIIGKTRQQQAIRREMDQEANRLLDIDNDYAAFADDAARQVFDKLTGRAIDAEGADIPEWIVPFTRGPLKDRTFDIEDARVEPWLNRNITEMNHRYARTMAAEVELTRKFGRADMRDQIQEITDDYLGMRMAVQEAATAEDARAIVGREKGMRGAFKEWLRERGSGDVDAAGKQDITEFLSAREKADIRDLKAMRDMLRGTYSRTTQGWDRVSRAISAFNYLRLMGGAVISNMQEIFRPAMVHGLTPYFRETIGPLFSKVGRETLRMSVDEARRAGQVVEGVLQDRLATVAEMGDRLAPNTAIERLLQNGTRVASRWNGLNLWTDVMKGASSVLSQDRIIRGVIGEGDARFLAYLGIDENMAGRLRDQIQAHAEQRGEIWIAHTEDWTDPEGVLKRAYRAALAKDVNSIIVTKSVGDTPLFAQGPVGRLFLQFKGFAVASHQRVLLRGLQEDKSRFISGMVAMTGAGMLAGYLRSWRGGSDRFEKYQNAAQNPGYLIGESLDLTGIFSLPFEVANATEKVTRFNPIKTPLMAAFPGASQQGSSTRFASRGVAGTFFGPTGGLADLGYAVAQRAGAAAAGESTTKQNIALTRQAAQLLPFYSYPGMREVTNLLLDGALPGFGD